MNTDEELKAHHRHLVTIATTFEVGDLVWEQMYSPMHPEWGSTIEERITAGETYGRRKKMLIRHVSLAADPDHHPEFRAWVMVDPDRPNDDSQMSSTNSNWCVLESAAADEGMLW